MTDVYERSKPVLLALAIALGFAAQCGGTHTAGAVTEILPGGVASGIACTTLTHPA